MRRIAAASFLNQNIMKLHIIGSSSAGNGYILQTEDKRECLILECGLPFKKYAEAIGHKITTIQGALITHEHGDHAKHIDDFLANGITTFSTVETMRAAREKFGKGDKREDMALGGFAPIYKQEWFNVGGFSVFAVPATHDAADPVNFVIKHPECGCVLFITDTARFPFDVTGITNVLIETNFDMETIEELLPDKIQMSRLMQSHLSVQSAAEIVARMKQSKMRNVILIHLSQRHGDGVKFKRLMMRATPKNIIVAESGKTINLNSNIQF